MAQSRTSLYHRARGACRAATLRPLCRSTISRPQGPSNATRPVDGAATDVPRRERGGGHGRGNRGGEAGWNLGRPHAARRVLRCLRGVGPQVCFGIHPTGTVRTGAPGLSPIAIGGNGSIGRRSSSGEMGNGHITGLGQGGNIPHECGLLGLDAQKVRGGCSRPLARASARPPASRVRALAPELSDHASTGSPYPALSIFVTLLLNNAFDVGRS
jgi:hypothetical protein